MTEANRLGQRVIPSGLFSLFKSRLFLFTTLVPTVLAMIYFGFLASDIYTSESRFVVRSPDRQTASPLGLLMKGAGCAISVRA